MSREHLPDPARGTQIWRNNKKDLRDLKQWVRRGVTVYTVYDMATNLAPYEDDHLYTDRTCTGQHPLLGGWMFDTIISIDRLLFEYGPVYEVPPPGIRYIGDPAPQVGGPLPKGKEHGRKLNAKEIAYLQRMSAEADARSGAAKRSKQALGNRWF